MVSDEERQTKHSRIMIINQLDDDFVSAAKNYTSIYNLRNQKSKNVKVFQRREIKKWP